MSFLFDYSISKFQFCAQRYHKTLALQKLCIGILHVALLQDLLPAFYEHAMLRLRREAAPLKVEDY